MNSVRSLVLFFPSFTAFIVKSSHSVLETLKVICLFGFTIDTAIHLYIKKSSHIYSNTATGKDKGECVTYNQEE